MHHPVMDGKTQAIGLVGPMVGILPKDDHFNLLQRAFTKSRKDLASFRIALVLSVF
jgi:hypothetical protein